MLQILWCAQDWESAFLQIIVSVQLDMTVQTASSQYALVKQALPLVPVTELVFYQTLALVRTDTDQKIVVHQFALVSMPQNRLFAQEMDNAFLRITAIANLATVLMTVQS